MDKVGNITENNPQKAGYSSFDYLSSEILAYCGYKIVDNKLVETKYEPNPNKKISCIK